MTSMLFTERYGEPVAVCGVADMVRRAARHANRFAWREYRGQFSLLQSRGVIFFSAAYLPAVSSTILRTIARSPDMNGVTCLKPVPSHIWNFTMPEPSWS